MKTIKIPALSQIQPAFELRQTLIDIQLRLENIDKELLWIGHVMRDGFASKAGYSEFTLMHMLGVKDSRTLKRHLKKLKIKGERFFPEDIARIMESISEDRKRPNLKKI